MHGKVKRVEDKFLIRLTSGKYAYLKYRSRGGIMYVDATFTPKEYRGRGLAEKLMKAIIEYARKNEFKIVPNCSYAKSYFERHLEYRDILVKP